MRHSDAHFILQGHWVIRTEYGKIRTRNYSVFGHFSRSGCFKNGNDDTNIMSFNNLDKILWKCLLRKFACYSNLLKSTNSHPENMQHHTNSISFRLFLNLKISGMPDLKELIFWIYTNNTEYNNLGIKLWWNYSPF